MLHICQLWMAWDFFIIILQLNNKYKCISIITLYDSFYLFSFTNPKNTFASNFDILSKRWKTYFNVVILRTIIPMVPLCRQLQAFPFTNNHLEMFLWLFKWSWLVPSRYCDISLMDIYLENKIFQTTTWLIKHNFWQKIINGPK